MFIDASAIVAILTREPDSGQLAERLESRTPRLTSAIAIYEASRAISRKRVLTTIEAADLVERFIAATEIDLVAIGADEARAALKAFSRFGKGRHPARLNMGDCFAYACASRHGAPLLYRGDDFARTDIPAA